MVGISIIVIVIRANLQMVIKLATLTAVIAVALPAGVLTELEVVGIALSI